MVAGEALFSIYFRNEKNKWIKIKRISIQWNLNEFALHKITYLTKRTHAFHHRKIQSHRKLTNKCTNWFPIFFSRIHIRRKLIDKRSFASIHGFIIKNVVHISHCWKMRIRITNREINEWMEWMNQAPERGHKNCQQTTTPATTSMCINTPIVCKIKQDLCDDMALHSHAQTHARVILFTLVIIKHASIHNLYKCICKNFCHFLFGH